MSAVGKPRNNSFNKQIAVLYAVDDWGAGRIHRHLMVNAKAIFGAEPISLGTVRNRVKEFQPYKEQLKRAFNGNIGANERRELFNKLGIS